MSHAAKEQRPARLVEGPTPIDADERRRRIGRAVGRLLGIIPQPQAAQPSGKEHGDAAS